MVRVNFTADDLARTRFSVAPAPLIETGLALVELRRASVTPGRPAARRWLREVRRTFPATARPLLELFGPYPPWPGFADSPASSLEEGLEFVRSTPRSTWRAELANGCPDRAGRPPCWVRNLADGDTEARDIVVRALRDFYAAVVAPRWESVVTTAVIAAFTVLMFVVVHRQDRAMKIAERAWIVSDIGPPQPVGSIDTVQVKCKIMNNGRTPAWITAMGSSGQFVRSEQDLPTNPNYTLAKPFAHSGTVLTPNGYTETGISFETKRLELAEKGEVILYFFGFVEYRDVFDQKHKTRYCYRLKPSQDLTSQTSLDFYIDGPEGYNTAD